MKTRATLAEQLVADIKKDCDGFSYNTVDKFILEAVYPKGWDGDPVHYAFQRIERDEKGGIITKETLTFSDDSVLTVEYYTLASEPKEWRCRLVLNDVEQVGNIPDKRREAESTDAEDWLTSCVLPLVTATETVS